MRRYNMLAVLIILLIAVALPVCAQDYRIEVLQVTDIGPFENSYRGFLGELAKNGIVEGENLTVNRRIIDFDVEKGGLWKKVGVLMRIKKEAGEIVDAKPDLALTIGTPATKYAKDKIISAGIPLVFTAVAIPEAAGCRSINEAGEGFTGATLYTDMKGILQIVRLAFPELKTFGIIHTDDDNGVAQAEEAKLKAPQIGMQVVSKEVNKKDSIKPAIEELYNQGAQAFAVPLDSYYGMRDYEPTHNLADESFARKFPVFSFVLWKSPGAILYVGADFGVIGTLSGQQAVKILKEGVSPDSLPILKQDELKIMVDINRMKELDIQLPLEVLQLAKAVE